MPGRAEPMIMQMAVGGCLQRQSAILLKSDLVLAWQALLPLLQCRHQLRDPGVKRRCLLRVTMVARKS